MKLAAKTLLYGIFLSLALNACSKTDSTNSNTAKFDGDKAYDYLVKQVEFGPRVPGSIASQKCRTYFYDYFSGLNVKVDSQVFDFDDPYSDQTIRLVNIIAKVRGQDTTKPGILLLAHYDSRPRTDYPSKPELAANPIDGANDGASGAAVLMEMANLLSKQSPPFDVDLVLVDGEDWGKVGDNKNYLVGSNEFARSGIRGKYRFGIVVDMVGDSDQQFYRESFAEQFHPELNNMIWKTAQKLGVSTFIDSTVYTILDDHISLATSGVPATVIIDFDYPYWHTDHDTPDKCSAQSLANVGKVLTKICYSPSLWP